MRAIAKRWEPKLGGMILLRRVMRRAIIHLLSVEMRLLVMKMEHAHIRVLCAIVQIA